MRNFPATEAYTVIPPPHRRSQPESYPPVFGNGNNTQKYLQIIQVARCFK